MGPAVLRGHRRVWGVAMDNRESIPGYKRYVDPPGAAPGVCVLFLDAVADAGASVNGAVIEVEDRLAPALDRRERNYERVDVGANVGADPASRGRDRCGRSLRAPAPRRAGARGGRGTRGSPS